MSPRLDHRRSIAIAAMTVLAGAAAGAAPAAAQSTRITALPASEVLSVRVLGDTIAAGLDTVTFISTNGGLTWHGSSRPAREAKIIDAVLVRNHRLFAGTFGAGVFVSDDLGTTWRAFNEGLVGGILDSQLDVSDLETRGDSLFVSTEGAGVFVRNLAATDVWHLFGNAFEPNQAANVNDLASDGRRLLACAGMNGMTFHRDPGDPDWTVSLLGNTGLRPGESAQSALFTGSRWIVGTNAGVFFSAKGEEPWTPSSTRIPGIIGSSLAHIGETLLGAFNTVDQTNVVLLDQSVDGGVTWTPLERVNGSFAFQLAIHGGDLLEARSDGLFIRSVVAATTSVDGAPRSPSLHFALSGAQPVREVARFRFDLPQSSNTALELFDITGRRAVDISEGFSPAGPHDLTVSARGLRAGVYYARLTSGTRSESVRLVHTQ